MLVSVGREDVGLYRCHLEGQGTVLAFYRKHQTMSSVALKTSELKGHTG